MKELRVVRIIDGNKVIINAGKEDGLRINGEFKIFEDGEEIIDPITNDSLGRLEKTKDIVEVCELMDKMCICKKTKRNPFEDFGEELLNVDGTDITGGLTSDEPIKVGDKVRCLKGIY